MNTTFDRHAQCLQLPAFVGGRLSAVDARAVVTHTHECRECRSELEIARRVHALRARLARRSSAAHPAREQQASISSGRGSPPMQRLLHPNGIVGPWRRSRDGSHCAAAAGYVWYGAANAAVPDAGGPDVRRLRRIARSIRQPGTAGRRSRPSPPARGSSTADGGVYTPRAILPKRCDSRALFDVTAAEPTDFERCCDGLGPLSRYSGSMVARRPASRTTRIAWYSSRWPTPARAGCRRVAITNPVTASRKAPRQRSPVSSMTIALRLWTAGRSTF